jgi:hypothetical protein
LGGHHRLAGDDELARRFEQGGRVVDQLLQTLNHGGRHPSATVLQLVVVLGSGRQLGHQHPQVATDRDEDLVEQPVTTGHLLGLRRLGSGDADLGLRLVHVAVGGRRWAVFAHPSAKEESGRPIIASARVYLHGTETTEVGSSAADAFDPPGATAGGSSVW